MSNNTKSKTNTKTSKKAEETSILARLNIKRILILVIILLIVIIVVRNLIASNIKDKGQNDISYYASFKDNKWGVIDSTGATIIDPSYQELIVIPNEKKDIFLCTYNVNYETGEYQTKAINKNNQEILTEYEQIEPLANNDLYEENLIKIKKDGKYGLINLDGQEAIPPIYDEISEYGETSPDGYLVSNEEGEYGLIDSSNNQILEMKYDAIDKVHGNDLYFVTEEGIKKVINKEGQEIVKEGFETITSIDTGIIFQKDGKQGYMDLTGNIKIEPKYEQLKEAGNNLLIAKQNDLYGIITIDTQEEKVPFENSAITYIKEAEIYILEDSEYKAKVINKDFQEKLFGMFLDINAEKQYIKMQIEDEIKYYNFAFEEKPETEIFTTNTLFKSKQNDKYGFVDKNGNVKVDYIYDEVTDQNKDGYAGVKKDGKWGSIDSKGDIVIEPTYDLDEYLLVDFVGRWHKGIDLNMNYYSQE